MSNRANWAGGGRPNREQRPRDDHLSLSPRSMHQQKRKRKGSRISDERQIGTGNGETTSYH